MSPFTFHATPIDDLQVIERRRIVDARGYLERAYCHEMLSPLVKEKPIRQINRTVTLKNGTVRGLHFQNAPHCEIKIVSCVRGEVFDVAVDLRRGSPTFLKWHAEVLSEINCLTFLIPEGFAHGFQTLSDDCELLYLHTADHNAQYEGALNALDPALDIAWPLPVAYRSERDAKHVMLSSDFNGIELS